MRLLSFTIEWGRIPMQGAFWKIVGIVGVLGIGGMTVMTLHQDMQRRKQQEESRSTVSEPVVEVGGDQTIDAEIPDSEFEKMLAASSAGAEQETPFFNQSEPSLTPDATTPQPVDSTIRASALSDMQNPFAGFDEPATAESEGTAVAANFQPSSETPTVESTSFEPSNFAAQDSTFAEDTLSADDQAPEFAAFDETETPPPAFGGFTPSESAEPTTFAPAEPPADAMSTSSALAASTATEPSQPPPPTTAATVNAMQFFGSDPPQNSPSHSPAASPFFEDTSDALPGGRVGAPDRQLVIAAPANEEPLDFPPFPSPNTPVQPISSSQPRLPQEQPANIRPDDATSPFTEDLATPDPAQPRINDERIDFTPGSTPAFDSPAFEQPVTPRSNPIPETQSPPPFSPFNESPASSPPAGREPIDRTPVDRTPVDRTPIDRDFSLDPSAGFEPLRPLNDNSSMPFEDDGRPDLRRDNDNSRPSPDRQPVERSIPFEPPGEFSFESERERVPLPNPVDPRPNSGSQGLTIPRDRSDFNDRPERSPIESDGGRQFNSTPNRDRDTDPWDIDFDRRDRRTQPTDRRERERPALDNPRSASRNRHPNLVLQKSAPKNATVGIPLKYSIMVTNRGDATAYNVTVDDQIPPGANINATRPAATEDRVTKKMFWKFDKIEPGESQEITVQMTPTGEGTIDGFASVRFNAQVRATTVITSPQLELQMIGPNRPVRIGEQVKYRYVIENTGSGMATNVVLRTELPLNGGLTHPQGNDLEYEIGNLPPNDRREVALSVVAAEAGEHTANARVTATGGAEDVRGHRINVIGAQLQIIRRGPQNRYVGRKAVFENMITNATSMDALDARVVETVPEGMKFVKAGQGGRYNPTTRTVTWNIRRLEAKREMSLKVELMPLQAGTPRSVVTVFENAGMQGREQVSTIKVEDLHNLSASLSQPPGPIAIGEEFGFNITIENKGTADATDVQIAVAVPQELEVIGVEENGVQLGAAINRSNNVVRFDVIRRVTPTGNQVLKLRLRGRQTATNAIVKANVTYRQMRDILEVSRAVTVFDERL